MSGLAHILEGAGLATVALALIPQHARGMRPPRALAVPFDLGRPLGTPGDAALQREVVDAALALLDRDEPGPVFETLDVDVPAEAEAALDGWACPVPLPADDVPRTEASDLAEEVGLLQPWFDRARRERAATSFGSSTLEIGAIVDWLTRFADEPEAATSPVESLSLGDAMKLAAEDLKAFYLEAATAQPGAHPAAALDRWFWDETRAGAFLRRLKERLSDHEDGAVRIYARVTLVPDIRPTR